MRAMSVIGWSAKLRTGSVPRLLNSLIALVVVLVGNWLAAPLVLAQSRSPYEIVRSMQALQDQIAQGNRAALDALPLLSGQLAEKLIALDPKVWREPRNTRAAITYVLSGGQPRVLRKILANIDSLSEERPLIEGTLAYVEGQESKAKQILGLIDPRSLEAMVGAHIAVTQASLFAREDPHRAIELLDLARVLAPGTLVEEAALRREVFLSEQIGDFEKFATSAEQYLRRFGASSYAENFFNRFSVSLNNIAVEGRLDEITRLEGIMNELSEEGRLRLYLAIAQAALVNGKLDTAQYAALKASSFAKEGTAEAARATLYSGAVSILTHPEQNDLGPLEKLDMSKLSRGDVGLAQGIMAFSKEIHHWPATRKLLHDKENATVTPPAGSEKVMASADSAIDLAEKALAAANDVPKGKSP